MTSKLIGLVFLVIVSRCLSEDIIWDHTVDLDDNYRLLWQVAGPDIIFEIQVKTQGVVGFGFARNDFIYGADVVIGFVEGEKIVLQDRHIPAHSRNGAPVLDNSQDYAPLSGHRNSSHTTLRFKRKLSTCDEKYDIAITNDTMKIVYMYHDDEPKRNSPQLDSFPDPELAIRPIRSLLLLQRPKLERIDTASSFEVTAKNFLIFNSTRTCNVVRVDAPQQKFITAFEPLFEPHSSAALTRHMFVYECSKKRLIDGEALSCGSKEVFHCFTLVATWSKGSRGFSYPHDVGYPLEGSGLYFIEVFHEQSKLNEMRVVDKAGFKFQTTSMGRKHKAGLLNVGIQAGWTHIIPPGLKKVTSLGYCSSQCTRDAFTPEGIRVIGAHVQTNEMGKSIKVSVIRNGTEMQPLARDRSVDSNYLEYRSFNAVQVLPGDDLTVECVYNSLDKSKLTLGGFETQQEVCQATLIYYPRQEKLTTCQSKPKTKNFLKALNIDKLQNFPPFAIELPLKYAGKTLEEHLKTYNWKTEFEHFEKVSRTSMVDVVCTSAESKQVFDSHPVSIKVPIKAKQTHCEKHPKQRNLGREHEFVAQHAKSKVSRSTELGIFTLHSHSSFVMVCRWLIVVLVPVALIV